MGCHTSRGVVAPAPPSPSGGDVLKKFLKNSLRHHTRRKPQVLPLAHDAKSSVDKYLCVSTAGELATVLRGSFSTHLPTPEADDAEFCKALSDMGKRITTEPLGYNNLPFQVFSALETTADACIFNEVGVIARKLTLDYYGACGHSRILIGARGFGKTVALQRLALVAPVLLPSLRVVYISASGVHSGTHPVHQGLVPFLFSLELRSDKGRVECAAGENATFALLIQKLEAAELYLQVLVDEMEVLYQSSGDHAYELIEEVRSFANTECGRVSFIGCSSSFCMYPLVKGGSGVPAALQHIFLAVKDASARGKVLPDMNATKLALVRIPAVLPPTSIRLDSMYFNDGVTPHQKRGVVFLLGGNVRLLYERQLPNFCCAPTVTLQGRFDTNASALVDPLVGSNSLVTNVCAAMYNAWYEQNAALLATVVAQGEHDILERIDLDAIGRVDWESEFKPIRGEELAGCLQRFIPHDQLQGTAYDDALAFLENDTALIVKFRNPSGADEWYPTSLLAVLLHDYEAARQILQLKTAGTIVRDMLKNVPQWVLKQAVASKTYKEATKYALAVAAARA